MTARGTSDVSTAPVLSRVAHAILTTTIGFAPGVQFHWNAVPEFAVNESIHTLTLMPGMLPLPVLPAVRMRSVHTFISHEARSSSEQELALQLSVAVGQAVVELSNK